MLLPHLCVQLTCPLPLLIRIILHLLDFLPLSSHQLALGMVLQG